MLGFVTTAVTEKQTVYVPLSGFTTVDLGCERGNNAYNIVQCMDEPQATRKYLQIFEEIWNEQRDGRRAEYAGSLRTTQRGDPIHIDVKEESDIDSLFSSGGTTALLNEVAGLEAFELISFLVVR